VRRSKNQLISTHIFRDIVQALPTSAWQRRDQKGDAAQYLTTAERHKESFYNGNAVERSSVRWIPIHDENGSNGNDNGKEHGHKKVFRDHPPPAFEDRKCLVGNILERDPLCRTELSVIVVREVGQDAVHPLHDKTSKNNDPILSQHIEFHNKMQNNLFACSQTANGGTTTTTITIATTFGIVIWFFQVQWQFSTGATAANTNSTTLVGDAAVYSLVDYLFKVTVLPNGSLGDAGSVIQILGQQELWNKVLGEWYAAIAHDASTHHARNSAGNGNRRRGIRCQ